MTAEKNLDRKELPMNPIRVCDAIAKIGYTPAAALMDIADNSVTAGANSIFIRLEYDGNYAKKGNVTSYQLFDNGSGMNEKDIANAFTLGSDDNYSTNSLSKFGMGLKSAGFSLGGKITVFSRKDGEDTAWILDRSTVEESGKYIITRVTDIPPLKDAFDITLGYPEHGALIEVTNTARNNNESAKKTVEKLTEELGIVYYKSLESSETDIKISSTGKPTISILPVDILYRKNAATQYNPDEYDFKEPCITYDAEIPVSEKEDCPKIRLEIALFPQDGMKKHPDFTEEQRKRIETFKIGRKHKGFFIYRNNRLIRWGDNLDGIVARDKYGFRARISLQTIHDDYLHVDVSKQHLNLPEDILDKIERACQQSLRWHDEIHNKCKELLRPDEGVKFNERNSDLTEEEIEEGLDGTNTQEIASRTKKTLEQSKEREAEEGQVSEDPLTPKTEPLAFENQAPKFEKIRYSASVKAGILWETSLDPTDGTFVRINRNHSFYETILLHLAEDSAERQGIEALLWCLATGENRAKNHFTDVEYVVIQKLIQKFKQTTSINLENWCAENQDLFKNA